MPNYAPRPWRMFLPLGLVLLLAALWSAYWVVASGTAKDRLATERTRLAAQGITIGCTEESWGGYPFHFEFTCTSPVLIYSGKAEVRSANLLLVALAYAPWQVAALIDGPTRVTLPGAVPTAVKHQRALATVTFDKAWQPVFSADVPAVEVENLGKVGKLMLFTRPSASGGTDVAVEASQIAYTPNEKPPIAIDQGSILGTLKDDRSFSLDKFDLKQDQLRYWGSGTLALDDQHRISGQVDTETNDIRKLLSVAGPQLGLSDNKLASLRTMLGLLGSEAKSPIIAKDGVLYLGPFQIAELKPIY